MTHTPGPWAVDRNHAKHTDEVTRYILGEWRRQVAALSPALDIDQDEANANAALIAAAPDLLAALEELVALPNKHRPDSVWQAARDAIRKARQP